MSRKEYNKQHIRKIRDVGLQSMVSALWMWKAKEGIRLVQMALNSLGSNLSVDGWFGDRSVSVLESFDTKDMNRAIGVVLDQTNEALEPEYITIARAELGVKEKRGKRHNKRILQYHKVSGGFSSDEVPWCGSFVNWVMREAGFDTVDTPARALSWINFGYSAHKPVLGAIAVKTRHGGGHVCFVVGKSKKGKYLYCLGGNQGDAVSIRKYPVGVFKDFRLPFGQQKTALPVYSKKIKYASKEA